MQNTLTDPSTIAKDSFKPESNKFEDNPLVHDCSCLQNRSYADDRSSAEFDFEGGCMIDDEDFAENYGLPIQPFTEDDLRFLRDFILSSAMYVEQLESFICDTSDDFWEAREYAYRIITALLIRHYEYELEG